MIITKKIVNEEQQWKNRNFASINILQSCKIVMCKRIYNLFVKFGSCVKNICLRCSLFFVLLLHTQSFLCKLENIKGFLHCKGQLFNFVKKNVGKQFACIFPGSTHRVVHLLALNSRKSFSLIQFSSLQSAKYYLKRFMLIIIKCTIDCQCKQRKQNSNYIYAF